MLTQKSNAVCSIKHTALDFWVSMRNIFIIINNIKYVCVFADGGEGGWGGERGMGSQLPEARTILLIQALGDLMSQTSPSKSIKLFFPTI